MEKEIWKDIPNYEGYYQVSNLGRVKSLRRTYWCKRNESYSIRKGRILKQRKTKAGYYGFSLCKNGVKKTFTTHKVVCMAFLNHKPCGYKLVVDHIDCDKENNNINNLRIVTARFNSSRNRRRNNKYQFIYWLDKRSEYMLRMTVNGSQRTIGYYKNVSNAIIDKNRIKSNNFIII